MYVCLSLHFVEIEGEIRVGAITKGTRTFTILIAASTPCLSPVANICS